MRGSRGPITLANLGPKAREQAIALLAQQQRRPLAIAPVEHVAAPDERRIKQSRAKLNGLELAYLEVLKARHGETKVESQNIRLRLANGQWYKPDFFIPAERLFIETKGPRAFRGGFENLKAAASIHQWAKFRLVWRDRASGQWKFQEVLP